LMGRSAFKKPVQPNELMDRLEVVHEITPGDSSQLAQGGNELKAVYEAIQAESPEMTAEEQLAQFNSLMQQSRSLKSQAISAAKDTLKSLRTTGLYQVGSNQACGLLFQLTLDFSNSTAWNHILKLAQERPLLVQEVLERDFDLWKRLNPTQKKYLLEVFATLLLDERQIDHDYGFKQHAHIDTFNFLKQLSYQDPSVEVLSLFADLIERNSSLTQDALEHLFRRRFDDLDTTALDVVRERVAAYLTGQIYNDTLDPELAYYVEGITYSGDYNGLDGLRDVFESRPSPIAPVAEAPEEVLPPEEPVSPESAPVEQPNPTIQIAPPQAEPTADDLLQIALDQTQSEAYRSQAIDQLVSMDEWDKVTSLVWLLDEDEDELIAYVLEKIRDNEDLINDLIEDCKSGINADATASRCQFILDTLSDLLDEGSGASQEIQDILNPEAALE
jgi:hypothetical protein